MPISDSGSRIEFKTGAVRDIKEGKGRCDLLPLGVVSRILGNDEIIRHIDYFVKHGDSGQLIEAVDKFAEKLNTDLPTLILEVSKHYEEGALKYSERNWEKGIPMHSYIDSAVRHYLKFLRGDTDERHDRAFIWNIFGALWTQVEKPDLVDLPFRQKEAKAFEKLNQSIEKVNKTFGNVTW